jgi:hypothetical protein
MDIVYNGVRLICPFVDKDEKLEYPWPSRHGYAPRGVEIWI